MSLKNNLRWYFPILSIFLLCFLVETARGIESDPIVADTLSVESPSVQALKLTPSKLSLKNASDVRRILISALTQSGEWIDVTSQAKLSNVGPEVSIGQQNSIHPAEKGSGQVTVVYADLTSKLPVTVESMEQQPVSFVRQVAPTLSRLGCNSGTCHGAAKGKNGFKLSLRGYDLDFDYQALVKDLSGRRFNRTVPEKSLMLLKPTQGVPHEGGFVLDPKSKHYQLLIKWIEEGVKSDVSKKNKVETLEVIPEQATIQFPGMKQQVLVIAHYDDGSSRDVTDMAIYSSSLQDVVAVSKKGLVTAARRGEASVLVRYEGLYETSQITVMGDRSDFRWIETDTYNYIDEAVYEKLKQFKILPAPISTDTEFVRRIYLDLTGLPPTPNQVRTFFNDQNPSHKKRSLLIDQLLDSPEFVDHWTHKWADLLQCNRKFLGDRGVWLFRNWIRNAVKTNKPYDQMVKDLLLASGSTYKNPAANYYRVSSGPVKEGNRNIGLEVKTDAATESATQLFLGVRFSCNKCHDHPFEKWTQNQYYEFSSFFSEVGVKRGRLPDEQIIYTKYKPVGGVEHPKTGQIVKANVPFGQLDPLKSDPRLALVNWLTAKDNPLFARSMANRMWSYFLGRGIIEPVDDIRSSNPPSNPKLLDLLTKDFIDHQFDLKHLMRTIVHSRVYQHSIDTNSWNETDTVNFSRSIPRRLTAEQLLDSIMAATGSRTSFGDMPSGIRTTQLPDSNLDDHGFLKLFGRPERESVCECERVSEVSLSHALTLINGPTIAEAIRDKKGRIAQLTEKDIEDSDLIEEIYLATLSRLPDTSEKTSALDYISSAQNKIEGAQDLMWALINSPAFLFNH
ncbi:DUF1553 domain-containing protein [Candidatus Poribacteria bacterium]|nr:DUF1553 domain-containing protein [Candidatus Poribacteria bacterium]